MVEIMEGGDSSCLVFTDVKTTKGRYLVSRTQESGTLPPARALLWLPQSPRHVLNLMSAFSGFGHILTLLPSLGNVPLTSRLWLITLSL